MKKFLFMLFAIFGFSVFACPLEEEVVNRYIYIYVVDYGYTVEQARVVISNVNNIRISLLSAGMNLEQVETLSTAIMTTRDPLTTTSNDALLNGVTTAQQNATSQGFGSLSVDSVSENGSGLDISMSATDGVSTTTAQVNTSSSVPTYSTTGSTSTMANQVATSTTSTLYTSSEASRPIVSSSSTTDSASGKSVRIIGGARVMSNGDGGSILVDGTIKGN